MTANERELINIVRESENPTETLIFITELITNFLNQVNNATLTDKAV